MGNVKWTEDQKKVIDLRNRNILVSAAAGSGKTAVLVERIITMITEGKNPVDIDRLLIVTFTEAAAGEMRERIAKAIEEKLKEQPDNLHLQKQEALLHSAQITTIHSFCLGVIRNYFNTIDLDPSFRIGDETELKLLKSDVLTELLEEKYEAGDKAFYQFIETYATGKLDNGIEDMILDFHNFAMSYPWPKKWMEEQRQAFFVDNFEEMEDSLWMNLLMEDITLQIESFCEEYDQLLEVAEESDGPYMYAETLERERAAFQKIKSAVYDRQLTDGTDYEELGEPLTEGILAETSRYRKLGQQLSIFKWERLSSKKDDSVNADKREWVKEKRTQIKKELDKIRERYFYQSPEEMLADMQKVSLVMDVLVNLSIEFVDRYQEKKEERGIVDFNDLEHFALQILVNPVDEADFEHMDSEHRISYLTTPVAKELQDVYTEILIDEYQDSNFVQETILTSISKIERGEPNVFMVGDVKQSIYKFRLARPELFMEKYENYTIKDSPYQRIDLHMNFRSRKEVLMGINYIFEGIMKKELGNIEYDEAASLNPGAEFEPLPEQWEKKAKEIETLYKTELLLIDKGDKDDSESEEISKEVTAQELETRAIAGKIKEYVSGGMCVWDKDKKAYRSARYSDMVILLRSPKSWTEKMTDILREEGIPAAANVQTGYFSALEVRTILNYLLVIDNPLQDIPLTGTLTSFIGNFTEEELAQIRKYGKEETLYESLEQFAKIYIPEDSQDAEDASIQSKMQEETEENRQDFKALAMKICEFKERLSYFRQLVPYTSVYDMIQMIYEKTGFYDYVTVLPGGSVRKGNLDMLLQKAIDFEATSYGGLFHFNRYIERLHEYDIDFGEAKTSEGSEDVVQLMSIHKSKGLEFPIVFLAGMFKKFNQQDARSRLVLHPDLGIGPDYVDYTRRTKTPTLLKKVIQRRIELENLAEELRVLYVALTRAKEKLVMVGNGKDLTKLLGKWQSEKITSYRNLTQAGSYIDWVGPRIMKQLEERKSGESLYDVTLLSVEDFVAEAVLDEIDKEQKKEELLNWTRKHPMSEEEKEQIAAYMNFIYPYKKEEIIKSKISVSELKKLYQKEEEDLSEHLIQKQEAYIPEFAREEEVISGAGRGTIYHKAMESLVFGKINGKADLKEQLKELEEKKILLPEEKNTIHLNKLQKFFESDLGKRMIAADEGQNLYKEQPFVMGIPAKEIDASIESEEIVLVQGIIDAYFEEEDGFVLVDYKTDHVADVNELIEKYGVQLAYYQKALEKVTQKPVKECKIYSFYLGKEISI